MKRALLLLALVGCGAPLVGPDGWVFGACVNDDMACDKSTGEAYACVANRWMHLTHCPEGGCPVAVTDGGWEVCKVQTQ